MGHSSAIGGLLVAQAQELGEHEGLSAVVAEGVEQVVDGDVGRAHGVHRVRAHPVDEAALALAAAHVVGAHVAGDAQQPGPHRRIAPVGAERAQGPQVGLLDEVLLLAGRPEGHAQPPHVGLGAPHQLGHGLVVALTGGVHQGAQGIG